MRRYLLRVSLTALILAAALCVGVASLRRVGLPFHIVVLNAATAVITPIPGMPLPPGIEAGDRIDLSALDANARSAVGSSVFLGVGYHLPLGQRYDFVVRRGGSIYMIPVETVELSSVHGLRWLDWLTNLLVLLFAGIGLLAMWRGRDWAAAGLAIWVFSDIVGISAMDVPADGFMAVAFTSISGLLFLLSRAGFYVMVEAMAGASLARPVRLAFRLAFALSLLAGVCALPAAVFIYYATGWAELLRPAYGLVLTASYLPPVALLTVAYRTSASALRLRLGWTLWGSGFLVLGIALDDTGILGYPLSYILGFLAGVTGTFFFLYAVLRHRVVDFAIVIDRALVYGLVTTLVVGAIAAVNSLALKFTLPPGAGLALQVVVPLALGIVLSKLRTLMDKIVEQVFFRKKYLTEQALRAFGNRAGHIDKAADLLEATTREVARHTGTSAVAIYSAENEGFKRLRYAGQDVFPATLGNNDDAALTIRVDGLAADLHGLASALGTDGCAFPMLVLGNLRGLLVVKNRAGEHFGSDEKSLLTQVAQDVGAAWRILRARDNEALVSAMASGSVQPDKAFAEARRLSLDWAGVWTPILECPPAAR